MAGKAAKEPYRVGESRMQQMEDVMRKQGGSQLRQSDPGFYYQDANAKPVDSSEEDKQKLADLKKKADAKSAEYLALEKANEPTQAEKDAKEKSRVEYRLKSGR